MNKEERESLIWAYIDGNCDKGTYGYVANMIAGDAEWKATYDMLMAFHASVARDISEEEPSMRFTKNLMDTLQTAKISKPAHKYINMSVVRLITAILVLPGLIAVCYIFANFNNLPAQPARGSWSAATNLLSDKSTINMAFWACVPLLLLFFDLLIRSRRTSSSTENT